MTFSCSPSIVLPSVSSVLSTHTSRRDPEGKNKMVSFGAAPLKKLPCEEIAVSLGATKIVNKSTSQAVGVLLYNTGICSSKSLLV